MITKTVAAAVQSPLLPPPSAAVSQPHSLLTVCMSYVKRNETSMQGKGRGVHGWKRGAENEGGYMDGREVLRIRGVTWVEEGW